MSGASEPVAASPAARGSIPRGVPDWAWVLGAAALARALALAGWCMVGTDSMHYLWMADHLAAGGGWGPPNYRLNYHPGFPALVAGVHAVGAPLGLDTEHAALGLTALAGTLGALVVYLLTRAAWGRAAARAAGFAAALHPLLIRLSTDVMSESCFLVAQGAAVAALQCGLRSRSWAAWMLAGAASAGALWMRAEGMYSAALIGVAGCVAAGAALRRDPRAAAGWLVRAALALAVGFALYFPYIEWVHGATGRWWFTLKGSGTWIPDALAIGRVERFDRAISLGGAMKAFAQSTGWVFLPFMAWGVAAAARRRALNGSAAVLLGMAAVGCAAPLILHLVVRYPHSPRYYIEGTFFLLPAAGYGVVAAAEGLARRSAGRRWGPRAAAAFAALVLGSLIAREIVHGARRVGLRQAGEWVLATYGPGQWMMSTREQAAYYARAALIPCTTSPSDIVREVSMSPGRLLVLLDKDVKEFEDADAGFSRRLDAARIAKVAEFPPNADPSDDVAWVYRSQ